MSVLSEVFGNCPQLKIIETFAENYNDKLYVADIVRMIDVDRATVHSHINKLLEEGLIEKKEKIGKIQFYQLNLDNPKAKMLLMLESYIVSERLEKLNVEDIKTEIEISKSTTPNLITSEFTTPYIVRNELYSSVDIFKKKGFLPTISKLFGLQNHTTNVPDIEDMLKKSKVTTYG